MRYTKQAMPLERQMDTLKQRGLIIDDEAAAQQALDTISYFRLADYWFHLGPIAHFAGCNIPQMPIATGFPSDSNVSEHKLTVENAL